MLNLFSPNPELQRQLDATKAELEELQKKTEKQEGEKSDLEREIESLEAKEVRARKDKRKAEDELEELKTKKKMEEEVIQHNIKIQQERDKVAQEKFEAKCERERDEAIAKEKQSCSDKIASIKDKYQDDLRKVLEGQIKDIKATNSAILERLPDVSVMLGKNGLKEE